MDAESKRPVGGLAIEYVRAGKNGTVKITAKLGDEILAAEKLDVLKPESRAKFSRRLCDGRPGIDAATLDKLLLDMAADLAREPEPAATDALGPPEIDVSHVVRPERIITPTVSGVSTPLMSDIDGKPTARWTLYLQWADGHRERRPLTDSIDVSDDRKIWIHPQPAEPARSQIDGWSQVARQAWLAGAAAPEPVAVFRTLCERFAYYLEFPADRAPGTTATLALWALLTYCYPAWPAVPYLAVGGPLGSGKSRVFDVLSRVVFRPLSSSSLTGAALFRTLHNQGGTLLFDEAERLKQTNEPGIGELLSRLLAGYKRGGQATRLEAVGDSFKTVAFDVYGPKALACIAGLPPALVSRCIRVAMFRADPKSEKPRRRIDAAPAVWQSLRDELFALALEHGPTWLELAERTDVCPEIGNRDYELWQPLLALAAWIEANGVRGLRAIVEGHALESIDADKDDATPEADETVLGKLVEAVRAGERPTPAEILKRCQDAEPATFKNWWPRTVTSKLKAYGIPAARKSGSRREYRDVTPAVLARIQTSYGIDLGFTPEEHNPPAGGGVPSQ